ncbi:membrane-anchored ubiquitin-fold protein 2 [Perilla frutescens var. frutescens]|nr:membrane-anchored ubiquitin-fold protein 2 [Perilla frutescens var. frutescens]
MSGAQDQLEIKFRLTDGSDIGPKNFPVATSIATLKENIIAQWPRGVVGVGVGVGGVRILVVWFS